MTGWEMGEDSREDNSDAFLLFLRWEAAEMGCHHRSVVCGRWYGRISCRQSISQALLAS